MRVPGADFNKIIHIAMTLDGDRRLIQYDLKVLISWLTDRSGFAVRQITIAERLNIDRSNVGKAFKRLVTKKILIEAGTVGNEGGRSTKIYDIHPDLI